MTGGSSRMNLVKRTARSMSRARSSADCHLGATHDQPRGINKLILDSLALSSVSHSHDCAAIRAGGVRLLLPSMTPALDFPAFRPNTYRTSQRAIFWSLLFLDITSCGTEIRYWPRPKDNDTRSRSNSLDYASLIQLRK